MTPNINLTPVVSEQVPPAENINLIVPPQKKPSKIAVFFKRNWLFCLTVLIPVVLACMYFGLIASDIFVSESVFVVRGPHKQSSSGSGLASLLGSSGGGMGGGSAFSRSLEDVDSVKNYILSRDALEILNNELDVKKNYESHKIDIFSRFNGFGIDGSFEEFFEYYKKKVSVVAEPLSSSTTLVVQAFTAEEAQKINALLLKMAEDIVNKINDRARKDLIKFAQIEVEKANEAAKVAALAVSDYRNNQTVVDPEKQTEIHFAQIASLNEKLLATKSQLIQMEKFAPNSPHPPALKLKIELLEKEIAEETAHITGGKDSLASKVSEFQRLQLEKEFQEKQLALALSSLENARNEAQRQQLYLETIAKPNLPDEAILPKRVRGILTTLVLGLVAWGILSLIFAGVKDHQH